MNLTSAWFWPRVSERRFAQHAILEALCAAIFVSAFGAVTIAIDVMRSSDNVPNYAGILTCVFYAGLAFGIYRKSRIAAASAFVLFLADTILYWAAAGPKGLVYRGLVTIALFHGIRGTIAYHKLPPRPANLPTIAESFQAVDQSPSRQDE